MHTVPIDLVSPKLAVLATRILVHMSCILYIVTVYVVSEVFLLAVIIINLSSCDYDEESIPAL